MEYKPHPSKQRNYPWHQKIIYREDIEAEPETLIYKGKFLLEHDNFYITTDREPPG